MAAADVVTERAYGNWRRPRSAGLFDLGMLGTTILLLGMIAVIVTMMVFGILPALILAVVVAVFLGSLLVRDRHGHSGLSRAAETIGWMRTRALGAHLYRSGPLGRTPWGTFQLPGLLAATRLSEWRDSLNRPFAVLHVPSTSDYCVVLATEPDGASLVDPEQVDSWVAHWGAWLAALGSEPGLRGASVTVEAAPDSGVRLRREIETHVDDQASAVAQAMLREIVETYPEGSATIRAWVTLTFYATARSTGRRRSAEEMGRDLASRLPGLTQGLHATGAGAARPVGAQELCEVVRVAYDPGAARLIESGKAHGQRPELRWSDVGPSAAEARYDHYLHDGAASRVWSMTGAPRGEVFASVLQNLLAPHSDVDRKRVTLVYRPLDSARAARIVEQDKRASDFRATSTKTPTARALADQRHAEQAAREEARGAGLVNFGMIVTATVTDAERLPDARAAIDTLSTGARVQLRPVYGSQDSAFAAGLPLGLVLPRYLKVPTELRESM